VHLSAEGPSITLDCCNLRENPKRLPIRRGGSGQPFPAPSREGACKLAAKNSPAAWQASKTARPANIGSLLRCRWVEKGSCPMGS
jgi:hypothetical protein